MPGKLASLGLLRGPKGDPGDAGPAGPAGPSGGTSHVDTLTDLRSLSPEPIQSIAYTVGADPEPFIYDRTSGNGFQDDGDTIIRISLGSTPISLGTNGRFYRSNSSYTVATIAALRLAVAGKQKTIHVQSHAVFGDGGGRIFDYDASDNTSADNGGTIIVAGTRRFKARVTKGVYDLRWFGGSPTASMAANTAALVAAATAANAAGGGTVFIPDGDYQVIVPSGHGSSAFHLTGISHVTLQGAGRYKTRLIDGGSTAGPGELYPTELGDPAGTAAFLTFQDCSDIHIKDLGFVGKGVFLQANVGQDAVNKKAVYFKWTIAGGTTDCSLTNCYFTLIEGEVLFADGWPVRLRVDRNHFVRCLTNCINYGNGDSGGNLTFDCSADDNVIESPGGSAFQGGGSHYSFSRNKVTTLVADAAITTSNAVTIVNSVNFLFEDNIFDGMLYYAGSPIVLFGNPGDTNGNQGARIRNNTFRKCNVLGKTVSTIAAIVTVDATYGPQVGYDVSFNKFLDCGEALHASYPNVVAIRAQGSGTHVGKIGSNKIDSPGNAHGIQTAVFIDSSVSGSNKILVGEHEVDAQVTTPYDFGTQPQRVGVTFGQPDVVLTLHAGTPEGSVIAGKGSLCGDTANGMVYVKNTGAGNTGWALLGTSGSEVPTSRTLTGAGAVKVAGDNAAHDLSADRTISIADAAAGTKGVIELDTDLGGTAAAPAVVALTGPGGGAGDIPIKAASITLDAARALFQILGTTGSQTIQIAFSNEIQLTAQAGGAGILLDSDILIFRTSAGTQRGVWNSNGFAIGNPGTPIVSHLSATQAPTFGLIVAGASAENEFTFAGAAIGDNVYASPDADPGANLSWCAYVKTAGKVTIRLLAGTTVTTNNVNWRVDVWKH